MEKATVIMFTYAVLTAYLIKNFIFSAVVELALSTVTRVSDSRHPGIRKVMLLAALTTVVCTYICSVPALVHALNSPHPYQDRLLFREMGVLVNLAVLFGYLFKPNTVSISIKRRPK